jgi:hypothetical protein
MSFQGALQILSSVMGRHLVQGNLVPKTNLVCWFKSLIQFFNSP